MVIYSVTPAASGTTNATIHCTSARIGLIIRLDLQEIIRSTTYLGHSNFTVAQTGYIMCYYLSRVEPP